MRAITKASFVAVAATIAAAGTAVANDYAFNETFDRGQDTVLDVENEGWSGGDAQKVRSGKAGNPESGSKFHAVVAERPYVGYEEYTTGPFTRFDGYSTEFGDGFSTSVDVYLDPTWADGEGFEWDVAAWGQDGAHQRDFIFHVKVVDGKFVVGASNNSGWLSDTLNMPANGVVVDRPEDGWVTLTHEFRAAEDGTLAVDMLVDDALVDTRNASADVIETEVGGNGYGWFTMIEADHVNIDNITLTR